MHRPFVRVVGVALTVSACQKAPPEVSTNPPEPAIIAEATNTSAPTPPPVPEPPVYRNPPAPSALPTWDSVQSGHPKGATNPPSPYLIASRNPEACFKEWSPGMIPPPAEVMAVGGRVVETPAEATGTQVQCPDGQPATLFAAHDAWTKKAAPL